jgi:hypothetical protein
LPCFRIQIFRLRVLSLGESGLVGGYNLSIYLYSVVPFNWKDKYLYLHTLCDNFSQFFFGTIPPMRQGHTRVNFVLKELIFLALLHSNACCLHIVFISLSFLVAGTLKRAWLDLSVIKKKELMLLGVLPFSILVLGVACFS